ncbi:MAG: hypothetical protein FWC40_05045 [Proteobacteria bacterium]|nr:hypothetical protein [Pseudomonadota bacterium]
MFCLWLRLSFRLRCPGVPSAGESTIVQESSLFSDTHDGVVSQDLVARRKSLLFSIVLVVGGLCLIGVLVIVILVNLVFKGVPGDDVPSSAPPVTDAPLQKVPGQAELSSWDISRLSDMAARAAYNAVGWTTSFGLVKGVDVHDGSGVADSKEDRSVHANTTSDEPSREVPAPKPVVRNVDRPPSTPATKPPPTPATKPPSAPATKPPSAPAAKPPSTPAAKPPPSSSSASRSAAVAKKFASAEQAETSGDRTRACEIYKSLLNDNLSKDDKLTVQSKVRQCGRTLL